CRVFPSRRGLGHYDDLGALIELGHHYVHSLFFSHVDFFPDDVRVDRKLASPTIDQHRERYRGGPSKVRQLIERGAHGSARVQHIVHDHDVFSVQIPRQVSRTHDGSRAHGLQIIPVERDVERALRYGNPFSTFDHLHEPVRELDTAPLNSNDDEIISAAVEFHYLDRHSLQGALDGPRVENRRILRSHRFTNMAPEET